MTDIIQPPQNENVSERALCEIHNRLSELVMLMQVLTLAIAKPNDTDSDFMKKLIAKAGKITLHDVCLPQTHISLNN